MTKPLDFSADSNLLSSGSLSDKRFFVLIFSSAFRKSRHRQSSSPALLVSINLFHSEILPLCIYSMSTQNFFYHKISHLCLHLCILCIVSVHFLQWSLLETIPYHRLKSCDLPSPSCFSPWSPASSPLDLQLDPHSRAVISKYCFCFIFKNGSVIYFQIVKVPSQIFTVI